MNKRIFQNLFKFFLLPALLIGSGWFAKDWHNRHNHCAERRVKAKGYKFISPLLDVELPEGYNIRHEPICFKQKVNEFVDQQIKTGRVKEMSVYYRDLSNGPWFGINEDTSYNPASMMKLPIMIAWFKRAETDRSVLKRRFLFDENAMEIPSQFYKPEKSVKVGVSYTVDELLRYMMNYSDNRALSVLQFALTPKELNDVLENMDVVTKMDGIHNSITVHGYSGFLRILYNASFLNKEMSERALHLMSYDEFSHGISAGVPKGTIIASKFGEYFDRDNPDIVQLHEFGIVYHPKGSYILGILTRGNNWNGQAEIIKSISEIVYKCIDAEE